MSPWRLVSGDEAAPLERELHRELPHSHRLAGRAARAHARRDDGDAVETDPQWPTCEVVAALPDDE